MYRKAPGREYFVESLKWFRLAARRGHALAQLERHRDKDASDRLMYGDGGPKTPDSGDNSPG
jgi:TPR repeat protein